VDEHRHCHISFSAVSYYSLFVRALVGPMGS
jgi:hypothetical protein